PTRRRMQYRYLKDRGALNEAVAPAAAQVSGRTVADLELQVTPGVVELVPEVIAREHLVLPLSIDGETITFAAVNPADIPLADQRRFLLSKNVRFLPASREAILAAINFHYRETQTESVDSYLQEFTDTAIDFCDSEEEAELSLSQAAPLQTPISR